MSKLKKCLHLTASLTFAYTAYIEAFIRTPKMLQNNIVKPGPLPYPTRFLTYWCIYLNLFYWMINFFKTQKQAIRSVQAHKCLFEKVNSYFFLAVLFPLQCIVTVYFWILFTTNPGNVLSKKAAPYFTTFDMHLEHSFGLIFCGLELIFTNHYNNCLSWKLHQKRGFKKMMIGPIILMVSYLINAYYHFTSTGRWPYPFLNAFWKSPFHVYFMVLVLVTSLIFGMIGKAALRANKSFTN